MASRPEREKQTEWNSTGTGRSTPRTPEPPAANGTYLHPPCRAPRPPGPRCTLPAARLRKRGRRPSTALLSISRGGEGSGARARERRASCGCRWPRRPRRGARPPARRDQGTPRVTPCPYVMGWDFCPTEPGWGPGTHIGTSRPPLWPRPRVLTLVPGAVATAGAGAVPRAWITSWASRDLWGEARGQDPPGQPPPMAHQAGRCHGTPAGSHGGGWWRRRVALPGGPARRSASRHLICLRYLFLASSRWFWKPSSAS